MKNFLRYFRVQMWKKFHFGNTLYLTDGVYIRKQPF